IREDLHLFSKEVSIRKKYICVDFRDIEKKFVFICAFAMFCNQLKLPTAFLHHARASEPRGEIVWRFLKMKFHAHLPPSYMLLTKKPGVNPALVSAASLLCSSIVATRLSAQTAHR